jgi:putative ATPase
MDLFTKNLKANAPLADRMRPETLNDFIGQREIIGEGKLLRKAIENDELFSVIFWGPPGSGKTTLARIIAKMTKSVFIPFSAVTTRINEVKEAMKRAEEEQKFHKKRTIIFIDEIHRFNKAQQDALLPSVENGIIILIGATTENPSFEVISPLLSRSKVFVLKQHQPEDIKSIIKNALLDKKVGLGSFKIKIEPRALEFLVAQSNGDARIALNTLEIAVQNQQLAKDGFIHLDLTIISDALQHRSLMYDKDGEEHYNIISALHKSMRGSDADASLYWLGRLLEAGENPLYVARRLIRFAAEDIGLVDPQALVQAVSVYNACHYIGLPECNVILAQAVVYLAKAPKSNALYTAYSKVQADVQETLNEPVPLHLRNASTKLMQDLGYGKNYKYTPDYNEEMGKQDYLPEKLKNKKYYQGQK